MKRLVTGTLLYLGIGMAIIATPKPSTTHITPPHTQPAMAAVEHEPTATSGKIAQVTVTPTSESTPQPTKRSSPPPAPPSTKTDGVEAILTKWANHYGIEPAWIIQVAKCESGLNPGAINLHYAAGGGNPSGVMQFLPQTFYANAARVGIPNPNLWSVEHQAQTAAWMFSIGQHVQWQCK